MNEKIIRCEWCLGSEIMKKYHDEEWGEPLHDDRKHFEFLVLDGAQAGLSWNTILNKREAYKIAFDNYELKKIIEYDSNKIEQLLENKNIIRNKLKINSVIKNARAFLKIQKEFGSFDAYIWKFVNNKPIVNYWKSIQEIPGKTELSIKISKDMKKRGFSFVGPTIIYAYLQAAGIVNDHITKCFKFKKLTQ